MHVFDGILLGFGFDLVDVLSCMGNDLWLCLVVQVFNTGSSNLLPTNQS